MVTKRLGKVGPLDSNSPPPSAPPPRCKKSGNSFGGHTLLKNTWPAPFLPRSFKWSKSRSGGGDEKGPLGFPQDLLRPEGLEGPRAGGFRAVGGGLLTSRG